MKTFCFYSILACTFILTSCGNSSKPADENEQKSDTLSANAKPDTSDKTLKIYSLPAPFQIPNAILKMKSTYSEELLAPTLTKKDDGNTNFQKAFRIGTYGVDMAYAMLFDQNQTFLNYFSRTSHLADEISIKGAFDPLSIESLKRNVHNRDSVIYIVLSAYNRGQEFLANGNRRDVGFVISAGSYIEGLHLSLSVNKKTPSEAALYTIGQQKLFLDNIIELLSPYHDSQDIKNLVGDLKDLHTTFDKVVVLYKPASDMKNSQAISKVDAPQPVLDELYSKTAALRKKMLE